MSALHLARSSAEAQSIIAADASQVFVPDRVGRYAIHLAAAASDYDHVKILLDNGADACCASKQGKTPLHYAAMAGKTNIVGLLLSRKADANCVDGTALCSPLHYAAMFDHFETVVELVNNGMY
jgi:ankyrin repeat protein